MQEEVLKLFNAVQIKKQTKVYQPLERMIQNGYILGPNIQPNEWLLDIIESVVGISGEKANATFHKSWSIVADTPMEILMIQQIIHYMTTYGFERLGIEGTVYIPNEILNIPEIESDIPLTVIRALTKKELLEEIIKLASGIALAQETLDCIMIIIIANNYNKSFIEKIKNRELKALLYDYYQIIPSEPIEFLRHLISKLTNESLLIKNDYLISKIKESNGKFLDELLKQAPSDLASIFFRFKPLFLAMKTISRNKTFFNQLRKKANKLHKPLPEDYLNSITARIKNQNLDFKKFQEKLKDASIFRKIRLAYALNYRLYDCGSIVYRIRNGRCWATDFNFKFTSSETLEIVIDSIVRDLDVKNKIIYIPSNINYTLPATEKQFTGHFPTGSSVTVDEDMIVGIHWTNTDKRVDLDLAVIDESGKIGWDSVYRNKEVLFSGDVTDASTPNGASELFYIKSKVHPKIMTVNFYNFNSGDEVIAKVFVAHEKPKHFKNNYMVNPNNIIASANINITKKQNILGLIADNCFYFGNINLGNSITSSANEHTCHARKYLIHNFIYSIDFKNLLTKAGAIIVDQKPEEEYLDLSPFAIDKTAIINLLQRR